MTYWTVLLITIISGPQSGVTTGLLYPTELLCREHHQAIAATLQGAYDFQIKCLPLTPSGSARPMARPEDLK